ncbi:nucleic acid/nucleotide deaminase domain-containing protein [Streptomyces sp. SudanB25_2051]|uniref:nucleic acid/nucleotide deaminase domain-containing protein n=1 Tax=Streptomyces sp. SudanB25_2051 TaxID=3035275 RepID=UPI003F559517
MSEPAREPSLDHFGPQGMRRFHIPQGHGIPCPESARETLQSVGVPLHVAPYFTAASPTDSLKIGVYAAHHHLPQPPVGQSNLLRLGTDGLAHLCVRPDGSVQAVFLGDWGEADMLVSSNVSAFATSLAALDRTLPVIAASTSLPDAAAAFRELNAELRQIDPAAFEDRESWWPRVLDDVRHTLNFPFSAAFEYLDAAGDKQIVTDATGPGRAHPEEVLWHRLEEQGVTPEQVRRVYCELQPCMMPGHYCAAWLQRIFPHAEFTHSFDYGSAAESREQGLKDLITHAAEQAER